MRSKKSKSSKPPASLWKDAPRCSEGSVRAIGHELAAELRAGDLVVLEGTLGAGKSTFASAVLEGLGADRPPEGSPTFPIVHRYPLRGGVEAIHIDLYRLKSEAELEAAGLVEDLWNRDAVVLVEWLSMFPSSESELVSPESGRRCFRVALRLDERGDATLRDLRITQGSGSNFR